MTVSSQLLRLDWLSQAKLPVELEREIFELAAFLHPEIILTLILVARRVQIWVEPLLYRTLSVHIFVTRPQIFRLPLRAAAKLLMANPPSLRKHAQHVCFVQMRQSSVVADFLSFCGAAVDVACISTTWEHYPDLSLLRTQPLRRLSFTLRALKQLFPWPDPFNGRHAFFSQITHLRILDWIGEWHTWSGLAQMPHLTHVSSDTISDSALRGVLQHCKLLEVFVFVFAPQFRLHEKVAEQAARAARFGDSRVVILVVKDRLSDWESGARGGEDFWVKASGIVKRRLMERKTALDH
ncbi:hypothetical protein MSAN_00239900 [Mycena sanguinolenta]|uniref:Uncharacterized protein n=1 Tax=Mycena sanguinolenta TaxID=230812 RepID=A0A8H6ZIW7_9AGAR|nr:hypothetical protein MSAN_00239900 [Mycena sanguinolenta]